MDKICTGFHLFNGIGVCVLCKSDKQVTEIGKRLDWCDSKLVNQESVNADLKNQMDEFKKYITSHIASYESRLAQTNQSLAELHTKAANKTIYVGDSGCGVATSAKPDTHQLFGVPNPLLDKFHPRSINAEFQRRNDALQHENERLQGKLDRATEHIAELKKNEPNRTWGSLCAEISEQSAEIDRGNETIRKWREAYDTLKKELSDEKLSRPSKEYDRMKAANGSLEKEIIDLNKKLKSADQSFLISSLRSEIVNLKARNSTLETAMAAKLVRSFDPYPHGGYGPSRR